MAFNFSFPHLVRACLKTYFANLFKIVFKTMFLEGLRLASSKKIGQMVAVKTDHLSLWLSEAVSDNFTSKDLSNVKD